MRNGPEGNRAVCLRLQCKRIGPETGEQANSLTYQGILLTGYEDGELVGECWIPVGESPTEADDERLVQALHEALLWQDHEPSLWPA